MDWIQTILIPLISSVVVVVGLLAAFAYMTLIERKLVGRFQIRYGPNRAGPFGLFQPIADALKAIFKEEIIPSEVDKPVYLLAPALAVICALIAFAVVPVAYPFRMFGYEIRPFIADVNVGVLYLLAVAGIATYGIVLAGWSSNNKYSLLGALRTAAQMISYEVPMGLALVSLLLITGSLSLVSIVEYQSGWRWLVFLQPVGFLIYFICGMAEVNRSPFDLPETENELVSGFATEYGGIKFAIFFMAEYINMIVISAVSATLFLGGWQGPFASASPVIAFLWFALKTAFVLFMFVWIRASLPRVRYDKMMQFCWKFLLPLSLLNLAVTALVVAVVA